METTPDELSDEVLREIREAAKTAELHEESLLQVPIIRRVFTDLNFRLVERGVDAFWTYQKTIPIAVTGFNPLQGAYYYGKSSFFSRWLKQPCDSARGLNENDLLLKEVLFMVHDYLHAWAYQMIDKLRPEANVFCEPISVDNLEEYSFYQLLTEAVATVGLDYWLLALKDINQYCDIGSAMGHPLTVSYRETHLPEYQRFCPDFRVQTPRYLNKIVAFYCTGKFPGFDASDLRRSPLLLRWLRHELQYGVTQRKLTRAWLLFLSEEESIEMSESKQAAALAMTPEFEQLAEEVSEALWQLVKHDQNPCDDWSQPSGRRRSNPERHPDFRFCNLSCWSPDQWKSLDFVKEEENFRYFLFQYLAAVPFASVPRERLSFVGLMTQERKPELVQQLMGDLPRISENSEAMRDLIIAN